MQNNTFSTLFVGQNIIKLKEVDSTNNYLKNLASKSEPLTEGTVIMADHQFAGRGQQDTIWQTEPGKNISASILLKPAFLPISKQFYLNIAVSVAISEALSFFLPEKVNVKWPNDIYYEGKKLGGLLIENSLTGSVIKSSVIGFGLNINQEKFHPQLQQKATSVFQILHKNVDLQLVMEKIFVYMEKYYLNLKSEKYSFLQKTYLAQLLNFNTAAKYKQNGQVFEGIIKGVRENGILAMEINGEIHDFNFKEIEYIHTK
ncbi:biotin--[acetyl-CoA-carboxylase] ligase [Pedobacter aquatilis]|uniref:biotin--[acetyl-CoA-carboxylase] ligase n=1 Tax=Pedobacter aquatilis TaxID=351343 RepID=UPI0025B56720|nr:biotin--[acetyl-CoA-carboxylase] ligase [Pedobacter aquatilis]MDN3586687.1 biotin--[acetyl-CoA-carboxylase] ligase [Pedobacter aquatilis]